MKFLFVKGHYYFLWAVEHITGPGRPTLLKKRNSLFEREIKSALKRPNVFRPVEVVTVKKIDKSFLKSLPADRPVLIRGAFENNPTLKKWTWDYVEKFYSNIDVPFVDTESKDNFYSGEMRGKELFRSVRSATPRYSMLFSNLLRIDKNLFNDLETEKFLDLNSFRYYFNKSWQLFLAGKGRTTNLHAELGTTFSMQITGEKRWYLFSPEQSLYINPKVNGKMYLESTDYSRFDFCIDKEMGIEGYEVLLCPGDILYFPACYWHFVKNETASISVSFKWTELKSFFKNPFLSSVLLTSRHPLVIFRLPFLKMFSSTFPPKG